MRSVIGRPAAGVLSTQNFAFVRDSSAVVSAVGVIGASDLAGAFFEFYLGAGHYVVRQRLQIVFTGKDRPSAKDLSSYRRRSRLSRCSVH